jgi:methionyl-tRNA formyltransferase
LAVTAVAFTTTLTKLKGFWTGVGHIFRCSGLPYFIYLVFWNGIFSAKEYLVWHFPFLKSIFRDFFSLKIWAREHGAEIILSPDFNSSEFVSIVSTHRPDLILTRVNQILKEPLLTIAPQGCWCFHSSELPKYQGIAAEFHCMINGEKTIGFTVMRMEAKLDAGPIIAQGNAPITKGLTLYSLTKYNNTLSHRIIRKALADLFSGNIQCIDQDLSKKSYYSWPKPEETRTFRKNSMQYISLKELLQYIAE